MAHRRLLILENAQLEMRATGAKIIERGGQVTELRTGRSESSCITLKEKDGAGKPLVSRSGSSEAAQACGFRSEQVSGFRFRCRTGSGSQLEVSAIGAGEITSQPSARPNTHRQGCSCGRTNDRAEADSRDPNAENETGNLTPSLNAETWFDL
jgi:hypothetical protein